VIDFKAENYQQTKQLAGKYVVCTNVEKGQMEKQKSGSNTKTCNMLNMHSAILKAIIFSCARSITVMKPKPEGMFCFPCSLTPLSKRWKTKFSLSWHHGTKDKSKLSFSDILEELKDIKLVTLNLGRNVESIKITELNEVQKQVLKLFNMKKQT